MRQRFILLFVFLVVSLQIACAPVCCKNPSPQNSFDKYSGLWDSSVIRGDKTDVMYTRITANGDIVEYDYDGDAVDKGLDCYTVETGQLISQAANTFRVSVDMHKNKVLNIRLTLLDDKQRLQVEFLVIKNEEISVTRREIWKRVEDKTFLDTEPTCHRTL